MDKLDFAYYNMDCMAGMKLFPDKFFDCAIVDPQYGINAPNMAMGTNRSRTKGGYPAESTASRLKRNIGNFHGLTISGLEQPSRILISRTHGLWKRNSIGFYP